MIDKLLKITSIWTTIATWAASKWGGVMIKLSGLIISLSVILSVLN